MGKFIDLTNQRFGKWQVIKKGSYDRCKKIKWICQCTCGDIHEVAGKSLRDGVSKSCRKCMKTKFRHGLSLTPTYRIWAYMISRCHNPKDTGYSNYGARGIKVCTEWRDDFLNFFSDMGEQPNNRTIDRIDNDKGYSRENCRWATIKEQNYNKRNTAKVGDIFNDWVLVERLDTYKKSRWQCIKCKKFIIYSTSMIKTGRRLCHCSSPHPCSSSLRN